MTRPARLWAVCGVAALAVLANVLVAAPAAQSGGSLPTGPWWATAVPMNGSLEATAGLVVTPDDTVVAVGYFSGTATFPQRGGGTFTLVSDAGSVDSFAAAVSPDDSSFTWVAKVGGTGWAWPWASTVLRDGTVIIGGQFQNVVSFPTGRPAPDDSITMTSQGGSQDVFIAALVPGTPYFAWAKRIGGTGWDQAEDMAVTTDDTIMVSGIISGTAAFPTGRAAPDDSITVSVSPNGNFVAALAPANGNTAWVQKWSSSWNDYSQVAVKGNGDVVIAGLASSAMSLPSGPGTSISVTPTGSTSSFVGVIPAGQPYFSWATVMSAAPVGGTSVRVNDVAVTSDGTIVVGGQHYHPATFPTASGPPIVLSSVWNTYGFIAAIPPGSTYFSWARQARGWGYDKILGLAVTRDDSVIATGEGSFVAFPTSDSASITLTGLPGGGGYIDFVAALSPSTGYFTWAQEIVSAGQLYNQGVALLSTGSPALVGRGAATTYFPTSADDSFTRPATSWISFMGVWPIRVVPGEPRNVTATAGNASASVSWLAPLSSGSHPILSYEVVSSPGGRTCTVTPPALACTVSGLSNGTPYTFAVRAISSAGAGPWSVASAAVTPKAPPREPPSAPWLISATPGNALVSVRWARPDYEGTAPISEYRVYSSPGGQVCTVAANYTSTWQSCVLRNLVNGQTYDFWVTAVNAVDESLPSKRLAATPRADPPTAPIWKSLVGGHERAIATWDPPASNGGGTMTEYKVYAATGGSRTGELMCTVPASSGPPYTCTMTGMKNLTSYVVWIAGWNEAGSANSLTRSVMPAPVRPGPPRELKARPGNFSATVSWTPPASEGTFPVETYQVRLDGIGVVCTVAAPVTSCTVPDLVPGKTYGVKVRAWSSAGWSYMVDGPSLVTVTPPPSAIGYPEVRRSRKDPTKMTVTGFTTGIKPGTRLYTLPPMTGDEYDRPVVRDDYTFIWKATVPVDEVWYVLWCLGADSRGVCSPRTLLIDPTM